MTAALRSLRAVRPITAVRVALVTAIAATLALAAGRVVDRVVPLLLVAVALPVVAALLTARRRWFVQLVAELVAVVAAVLVVVVVAGGDVPGDVVTSLTSGVRRVLSTEWPSPDRPDVLGTIAAVVAVATALAALLAVRGRWHLAPLLPLLVLFVLIAAASAPAGAMNTWLVPLGVLAATLAALGRQGPVRDRVRVLAGERHLVAMAVVAALVGAGVAAAAEPTSRADPRSIDPPEVTAAVVDPLEATAALRSLEPPITISTVRARDGATELPTRWRTAALGAYDGRRWTPVLQLQPIGRRLGPADPDAVDVVVTYERAGDPLVPLPGPPVVVEADVATDPGRTVVQLLDMPSAGTQVPLSAVPAPTAVPAGAPRARPVDELAAGFTETAESLAGSGTVLDQLRAIESAMREDFELDPGAPGAGQQLALIERFVEETRRGTAEQFVAGFVLLARSLGVDARIATGFVVDEPASTLTLSSTTAASWPEVAFEGVGWVAFDPVPEEPVVDEPEEPQPPRPQSRVAAQPPIQPPDPPVVEDEPTEEPEEVAADEGWSPLTRWVVRSAVAMGVLLLPLAVVVAAVLLAKRRRRRRLLDAPTPAERIRGAWAVATDLLVDAGLSIRPAWTDRDIAIAGTPLAPAARAELHRLGAWSSAATFASTRDGVSAERAAEAAAEVARLEAALAESRTRWARWRWRLSLRSLLPATRSPVLGDRPARRR